MIPFERIGSKEHAFVGYVDDIRLGSQKTFASNNGIRLFSNKCKYYCLRIRK